MTKPWASRTPKPPVLLSPLRGCKVCRVPKNYPAEFGIGRRVCHSCRALSDSSAQRERMKAWRAQRRSEQRENMRGKRVLPDRFAESVATLERTWGPYATWTRVQHAQHSAVLRQLAGVPEDVAPDARKVAA